MQRTYYPPVVDPTGTIQLPAGQAQVLEQLMLGHTTAVIARTLGMSEDTVRSHAKKVMTKAGARDRTHLVALVYSGAVQVLVPLGESYLSAAG